MTKASQRHLVRQVRCTGCRETTSRRTAVALDTGWWCARCIDAGRASLTGRHDESGETRG